MTRKLTLRREALSALTTDELRGVAGAGALSGTTCPVKDCLNSAGNCLPSFEQSCLDTACQCTPSPAP